VSRYHTRASYFYLGRNPDSGDKPTTLSESGDRSPHGYGYANTGTKRGNIIEQGGGDASKFFQPGADDNTSQTEQARKSFMDNRTSKLVVEQERGHADENRMNRQQAKMRLKGEVF